MAVTPAPEAQSVRLIPISEVIRLTGRGRSRIYAEMSAGRFPKAIKDGASTRWLESEINFWLSERVRERDARAVA